jgi:hypothetical protein
MAEKNHDVIIKFRIEDFPIRVKDFPESVGFVAHVSLDKGETVIPWHEDESEADIMLRFARTGVDTAGATSVHAREAREIPSELHNGAMLAILSVLQNPELIEAAGDHKINFEFARDEGVVFETLHLPEKATPLPISGSDGGSPAAQLPEMQAYDSIDFAYSIAKSRRSLDGSTVIDMPNGTDAAIKINEGIRVAADGACISITDPLASGANPREIILPARALPVGHYPTGSWQQVTLFRQDQHLYIHPTGNLTISETLNPILPIDRPFSPRTGNLPLWIKIALAVGLAMGMITTLTILIV